jgi:hypothetical protein
MKLSRVPSVILLTITLMPGCILLSAQEEAASPWSAAADIVTSFVWRGTRLGSGPHLQPVLEYSKGRFTAGAWGSFDLHDYEEVDLYFLLDLPYGLSVGMQDYYLPGLKYFDFSATGGSHALEVNAGYETDRIYLNANYIINEAGGVGSFGNDLYFEGGLSFMYITVFIGAGNGWHTVNGNFNVCNMGLEVSGEIEITEIFSIPANAQLIFNPDRERMFLVAGFTLHFGGEE